MNLSTKLASLYLATLVTVIIVSISSQERTDLVDWLRDTDVIQDPGQVVVWALTILGVGVGTNKVTRKRTFADAQDAVAQAPQTPEAAVAQRAKVRGVTIPPAAP